MSEKDGNNTQAEESEHSEDDESDILEESPCGRWLKRNEEVSQRNVPGIDRAYLAMDSEEGMEVVWNEVQFSERKSYKAQEEKIRIIFDNLTKIDHANIVKFHRYWIDSPKKDPQKTRVIFITEYMSSGSVKKFLNKTKEVHKYKSAKSWKRWCIQILSALSYLHSCDPPIVHGNLTCDTIFIQHNGLLKIGSVAPDAIRNHVKTYFEINKNLHYFAPECTDTVSYQITPAVDIYSFGICALEMALPKTHLVGGESKRITNQDIERAVTLLEDVDQQNFIRLCMDKDPLQRPSARALLLHPVLFEVHSLKLLSAHSFVKNQEILPENMIDFYKQKEVEKRRNNVVMSSFVEKEIKAGELHVFDVDKYLEDVRNGIHPLTAFALPKPPRTQARTEGPPSRAEGPLTKGALGQQDPKAQVDPPETRKIVSLQCCFLSHDDGKTGYEVIIQLRFEDKMNRQLRCDVEIPQDSPEVLAAELANLNFIREADKELVAKILEEQYPNHLPYVFRSPSGTLLETINEQQDLLLDHNHHPYPTNQYNNNNNNTYDVFSVPSTPLPQDLTSPSDMSSSRPLYFFSGNAVATSNNGGDLIGADSTTAVS